MALSCLSSIGRNQIVILGASKITIPNKFIYYNFETLSDVWNGSVAYSNNGSSRNTVLKKYGTYSGRSGGTVSSTQYMTSTQTNIAVTAGSTGISFSFWFYMIDHNTTGDQKIWEMSAVNKYFVRINRATQTFFFCDKGSGISFTNGAWHHVVCTIDSSNNGQVYYNGVLSTTFNDREDLY